MWEKESIVSLQDISETVCLFCNYGSKDVETNLIHMSVLHGFFLPDAEFCTDIGGMLHYLGNFHLCCHSSTYAFV